MHADAVRERDGEVKLAGFCTVCYPVRGKRMRERERDKRALERVQEVDHTHYIQLHE